MYRGRTCLSDIPTRILLNVMDAPGQHYDIILAGGGAAGLTLAVHLVQSGLKDLSILIVDPEAKVHNDRTWCFWSPDPTLFDSIVHHRWRHLDFISDDVQVPMEIAPYDYRLIRSIDFYRYTRQILDASGRVSFLNETVDQIIDGDNGATVVAAGESYRARWVFDSRWVAVPYRGETTRYHYLQQHFLGWIICSEQARFDPSRATMFDLRVRQDGMFRFVYTLPFSPTEAMVEYTIFSADLLSPGEYREALGDYVRVTLGLTEFTIVEEESCLIPMTDEPFSRDAGHSVMRIGTRGGRVKASTGYAFLRIQQDSALIVQSLLEKGDPFHGTQSPARYRTFDTMLLQILYRHGDLGKPVFTALFTRNPIQRIFRFLDEVGSVGENLRLMATVPWWPFIRAWLKLRLTGRV